jgi:hypothetical protein
MRGMGIRMLRKPSVNTEDFKDRVDAHVHENRQFTNDELHEVFPCVYQSVLYETVTGQMIQKNLCQMGSKNAHK